MYASDGRSLGFRSLAAARRLIANGFVEAVYGRKGHLKAIHAKQPDGASAIATRVPTGTRYSFRERLDNRARRAGALQEHPAPHRGDLEAHARPCGDGPTISIPHVKE